MQPERVDALGWFSNSPVLHPLPARVLLNAK
jgi:hypothetical protein